MSEQDVKVEINQYLDNAQQASAIFNQLDQKHTDRIVKAAHLAGLNNRVKLAKMAAEETGIGNWEDKVLKNVVATQYVYEDIKDMKTVGVISEDFTSGITEIAQPIGPILGIIPSTNPTSTVMFKILIALKTRNPIILSFNPKAEKCCSEAARILYEAALQEDAPEDCIQWIQNPCRAKTSVLMPDRRLALILATGGEGLVHSAYSSGTPALGVGPGNVPVFIESSADIPFAVDQVMLSKTFDNGTICASEQAIIVEKKNVDMVLNEFKKIKAYIVPENEIKQLEEVSFNKEKGVMNVEIVGKSAAFIAEKAGLNAPSDVRLLIAKQHAVGVDHPLSSEILAPVIAFYEADDFDHAVGICIDLNFHGGMGHTASIFSNDDEKISQFSMLMNAGRIVVNCPSALGGVGGMYNALHPSLTLGCGSGGGNITTDNVTATHLINIQRVTRRRVNQRMVDFDNKLYYDETVDSETIEAEFNRNY
jgi:acetaldehyde dehydrogenase / alcohol dehydrogenase